MSAARRKARPGADGAGRRPGPRAAEPDAVTVAYVYQDEAATSWAHSMFDLLAWDAEHEGRLWRGGYVRIRMGTDGLPEARNLAVREYLRDRQAPWLWWVDTDMGFGPETVERLLASAHPEKLPVVGALCFSWRQMGDDGLGGFRCLAAPTVMDWGRLGTQQGFGVRWNYPRGQLVRVAGTGAACVLVHRSAFERVRAAYGETWYDRLRNPTTGQLVSEDLSFCMKASSLSIPIAVHTGVETSHMKAIYVSEDVYFRERLAHAALPDATGAWPSEGADLEPEGGPEAAAEAAGRPLDAPGPADVAEAQGERAMGG